MVTLTETESAAAASARGWNLNRLLVLLGAAGVLTALTVFSAGNLAEVFSPDNAPILIGTVAALVLASWARPWLYLVAGILVAAFPLVIIFVFGAYNAILHPVTGSEAQAVLLLLLGSLLALIGGIAGFVQGRRQAHTPLARPLASFHGVAAVLVAALFLGAIASTGFAGASGRLLAESPASYVEGAREMRVVTTGYTFAPKDMRLAVGELTVLKVENGDTSGHTFTYVLDGVEHTSFIPAESKIDIPMKFDSAQTIHVWCQPHSMGPEDRSEESMWGTLTVA